MGYGMASRVFHAPVVEAVPGLRLLKIVERRGEESRGRHAGAETVREFDEVLADEAIELVVVATPNDSHFDLAGRALMAGKHVVVEKPFTNTSAEARELTALARSQNRLISAHHNRRWDGDFMTVRRSSKAGSSAARSSTSRASTGTATSRAPAPGANGRGRAAASSTTSART